MEMTIGAVLTAPSSQPQAKASESGFSNVLAEVETSSQSKGKTEFSYTKQKNADVAEPLAEVEKSPVKADFDTAFEEFVFVSEELAADVSGISVSTQTVSAEFKSAVVSLISSQTDGTKEENDRVIDALLKILKKMQNDTEDGSAASLLMELLASLTGVDTDAPVFELKVNATELRVTTENTEIAAILSSEQPSTAAPATTPAETAAMPLAAEVITAETTKTEFAVPTTENNAEATVTAEKGQFTAPENATAEPTTAAEPQETLLNDLLVLAKKELGLTKAVLTTEQTAVQPEQAAVQTESTFIPVLNHKDGTSELNTILSETAEEYGEATENVQQQEIKPVNITGETAAALTANTNTQQVQIAPEQPEQVEVPLPEQQIADEILSKPETLNGGKTEFTMVLNPEHLGKITVRLVSTEGRVEVNIQAENDSTRQLLESRAENIGTALRNNGVELERYQVVSEHENAELMQQNYDGSSKNPYGRNDEEKSQDSDSSEDFLEILQQL